MKLLVIAALLVMASPARADPREAMTAYYDGEITGGWVLTAMGAAGLTAGGVLYADGGDVARGASYVSLGIGAAHLAAGVYINIASRVRKRIYNVAIARAPAAFVALEGKRMEGVSKTLLVLKIVEVGLVAGGGTMAAIGHAKDHPRLEGAGYALAVEAAATLIFDIVASRRAHRYRDRLGDVSITQDAAGQPVVLLGPTLRF